MFRFIKDLLLHRLRAKTRHGVHSPFVYALVDEVIYNFSPLPVYNDIEKAREGLLKDERILHITDLGAGSHLNKKNEKKVSELAKNALKSPKLAQLIYRLANAFKPAVSIELGTCLGITTAYLAKAMPQSAVISVEGCPETSAVAAETIAETGAGNVQLLTGNFDTVFPEIVAKQSQLGLVFIDGNHRKQATLAYFNLCLPKVDENSILIFDDIYWSAGMKEAWSEIKAHPQVTLTIDLFWIGLVLFKKGRKKEDFRIRF